MSPPHFSPLIRQHLCCSSQPVTARVVARQWKPEARSPFLGREKQGKGGREQGGGGGKEVAGGEKLVPAWGSGTAGEMRGAVHPASEPGLHPTLETRFPQPPFRGSFLGAAPLSERESPREGWGNARTRPSCEDQ